VVSVIASVMSGQFAQPRLKQDFRRTVRAGLEFQEKPWEWLERLGKQPVARAGTCMTLWPVIVRELRAQARQPATYWLRVAAAGDSAGNVRIFVTEVGAPWVVRSPSFRRERVKSIRSVRLGALLFGRLNAAIFLCNAFLGTVAHG
jgi:hypothetical protein